MVETLATTVSSRLNLTQLGWVVQDEQVYESNRSDIRSCSTAR
jgi:hypothetical protein